MSLPGPYAHFPAVSDPTNVTGKRITAWLIDAAIYLFATFLVAGVAGYGPSMIQVEDTVVAEWARGVDMPYTTADKDAAGRRFCQVRYGVGPEGVDGASTICTPVEENGVVVVTDLGRVYLVFGVLVVVFIVVQGLLGGSLGKLAMGLRIVKADGSHAGLGASAVRTVLWIVDGIACATPLLGGILILTTNGHRRVGDMAAGTFVVPASAVGHPVRPRPGGGWVPGPGVPTSYPAPGPGPWIATPPVAPPGAPGGPFPPVGAPPTPPAGHPAPGTTASVGSSGTWEADVPIWDEVRDAWIQYDSDRSAWLEYDERLGTWKPIST